MLLRNPKDVGGATVSPDGRSVVFWTLEDGRAQLHVAAIDGSADRRLLSSASSDTQPTIADDGQHIVFVRSARRRARSMGGEKWVDDDLWVTTMAGDSPVRLTRLKCEDLSDASPTGAHATYVVSLPRRGVDPDVCLLDVATAQLRQLTAGPRYNTDPTTRPGVNLVAYISDAAVAYQYEVWTMNLDGSSARQLTSVRRDCRNPRFFPSGESLVFVVDDRELWRVNVDGSELRRVATV